MAILTEDFFMSKVYGYCLVKLIVMAVRNPPGLHPLKSRYISL